MSVVLVTGSAGLVGSAVAHRFSAAGWTVVGVDNDSRAAYFGPDASTLPNRRRLHQLPDYLHAHIDIRDQREIDALLRRFGSSLSLVVHAAAQPSHDWSATDPLTDFDVNAFATVRLLDAWRRHASQAPFVFLSTNKVYGDLAWLSLGDLGNRYEPWDPELRTNGIPDSFPLDQTMHSPFGASKLAADVMVQEFGRYYDLATCCLRGGTLTGSAHAAAELHGFLAYLVRCAIEGRTYTVYGYGGKQVRDVLHADDVAAAIAAYYAIDPQPGVVYNIGGGPRNSVSVNEAIGLVERVTGRTIAHTYTSTARRGDHRWYVSDVRPLYRDLNWLPTRGLVQIVEEIADNAERGAPMP